MFPYTIQKLLIASVTYQSTVGSKIIRALVIIHVEKLIPNVIYKMIFAKS